VTRKTEEDSVAGVAIVLFGLWLLGLLMCSLFT
jgi:hypothetical protein